MYTISTPTRRTSVRRGASTKSSSGSTNADVSKTVLSATATRSPPRAARAGNGTDRVAKRGRNLDDGSDEGDSDSAVSGSRRCRQATEVTKVVGQVPASPIGQPPATNTAAIGPPELGHTRASGERYHPTSPRAPRPAPRGFAAQLRVPTRRVPPHSKRRSPGINGPGTTTARSHSVAQRARGRAPTGMASCRRRPKGWRDATDPSRDADAFEDDR